MRSFETSGLLCCGRKRDFLCLNFGAGGRVLALGLGLGLGFGLVMPETAQAACVATPDCAALGYTKSSCPGTGVKCPWNTSKMFCGCSTDFAYDCSGTGYAGGVGGACGGKYTSCNCASGYDWNGSGCIACDSAYKYACTNSYEASGVGASCGGKYMSCACDGDYHWNEGAGRCVDLCYGVSCSACRRCVNGTCIIQDDCTSTLSRLHVGYYDPEDYGVSYCQSDYYGLDCCDNGTPMYYCVYNPDYW